MQESYANVQELYANWRIYTPTEKKYTPIGVYIRQHPEIIRQQNIRQ